MSNFQVKSLLDTQFSHLFELTDSELNEVGAIRMIADRNTGFPCRVSLQNAEIGEEVILLTYEHHQTHSPYRSSGPIFIRKNSRTAQLQLNEIPEMLERKLLSVRAYDKHGMMRQALVSEEQNIREALTRMFDNTEINYVHIHSAKEGCFNCAVDRA
jgi:hypothetical protein